MCSGRERSYGEKQRITETILRPMEKKENTDGGEKFEWVTRKKTLFTGLKAMRDSQTNPAQWARTEAKSSRAERNINHCFVWKQFYIIELMF